MIRKTKRAWLGPKILKFFWTVLCPEIRSARMTLDKDGIAVMSIYSLLDYEHPCRKLRSRDKEQLPLSIEGFVKIVKQKAP